MYAKNSHKIVVIFFNNEVYTRVVNGIFAPFLFHCISSEAYGFRENPSMKARLKPHSGITEDLVTDTCCTFLPGVLLLE